MNGEPVLVMLVEDNVDHAELVLRTLEEHRIANTVLHFLDGQSALDYLYRRGEFAKTSEAERPHVILLDLRLPRVDGLDVLKTIKEDPDLKSIPVVVLTTSEAEKDLSDDLTYFTCSNNTGCFPVHIKTYQSVEGKVLVHHPGMSTDELAVQGEH